MSVSNRKTRQSGSESLQLSSDTDSMTGLSGSKDISNTLKEYCGKTLTKLRETVATVETLQKYGEDISRSKDQKHLLSLAMSINDTIGKTHSMLNETKLETTQLMFKVDELMNKLKPEKFRGPGKKSEPSYNISFVSNIDISLSEDISSVYHVYGMESLPDGRVLITDYWNKCLKVSGSSQNVSKMISLEGYPWGLCTTDKGQFVVSLTDSMKIVLINFDGKSMSVVKKIPVGQPCRGICYHADKFFVLCAGVVGNEGQSQLQIVAMNGTSRVIKTDASGNPLLNRPRQVHFDTANAEIFVTDAESVKVLDLNGREVRKVADTKVKTPYGICQDGKGGILTAGFMSHNVLRFTREKSKPAEMIAEDHESQVRSPVSLFLHPKTDMLYVGMERSKYIKIFQIEH